MGAARERILAAVRVEALTTELAIQVGEAMASAASRTSVRRETLKDATPSIARRMWKFVICDTQDAAAVAFVVSLT
jgi:hypothetical protein